MKKYFLTAVMALMLVMVLLPIGGAVAAAVRYPDLRGAVTDDANALSKEVAADIAELQVRVLEKTGVRLYVAVVHFLDGVDVQTYANDLFARWELGENDFLLLGAAGEDVFAGTSGAAVKGKLTDSNVQSLLFTSGFSEDFRAQQYDAAFSRYFVEFANVLSKQYAVNIPQGRLFSAYQPEAKASPVETVFHQPWQATVSETWGRINESFAQNARQSGEAHERRERERNGISSGGWIVLVVLFLLIFRRRKYSKRSYQRQRRKNGCSPLGWVVGAMGFGMMFGKKRR